MALKNVDAIIGPQKNTSSTIKFVIPVGMVRTFISLLNTVAYKNSFQERVKEKKATTANAGNAIGMIIRKRTPTRVQPSTIAASSSSMGMDMKYPIKSQVQKGMVNPR